jgi:putative FmdB family regulatory protein
MPIYEYKCASCGQTFTKLQKFSDEPLTFHEECGSGPVERLISAPAFHFKGTGWYVTDYAKNSAANPSGEGKAEGDKAETKSADSKPAETKPSSSDSTGSSSNSSSSSSSAGKAETKPAS